MLLEVQNRRKITHFIATCDRAYSDQAHRAAVSIMAKGCIVLPLWEEGGTTKREVRGKSSFTPYKKRGRKRLSHAKGWGGGMGGTKQFEVIV